MSKFATFITSLRTVDQVSLRAKFKAERVLDLGLDQAMGLSLEFYATQQEMYRIASSVSSYGNKEVYQRIMKLILTPYEHAFVFDRVNEAKWRLAFLHAGGLNDKQLAAQQIRPVLDPDAVLVQKDQGSGWAPF